MKKHEIKYEAMYIAIVAGMFGLIFGYSAGTSKLNCDDVVVVQEVRVSE